jgi:hypothetical protein
MPTTLTAGTFTSKICFECDGTAIAKDETPHPVYTDGYLNEVIQTQMVVIGGPNGLNS